MPTLAIFRPREGADADEFRRLLPAEREALVRWKAEGLLDAAYSPGGPGAVLLLAADIETVRSRLAELPLDAAGLVDVELTALEPISI